MAIRAEERFNNVKQSLFNHIESNYTTTTKLFQGSTEIDTTAETEWVWFGIPGVAGRRFVRQVGSNLGNIVTILVQAIIYVKPTTNITRVEAIRDIVVNLLRRANIQVVDYVGNNANLGKLYGQDLLDETNLGIVDDTYQYSLLFNLSYLEEFNA